MAHNLRNKLRKIIKGKLKTFSAISELGCSVVDLKLYLESLFYPGMSWENWGISNKDKNGFYWEIDHIIPIYSINLLDNEQILKVIHYTNLRPCWAWANNSRRSRPDNEIDFSSPVPKYFNKENVE